MSEFFRQPERFIELQQKWLPKLLGNRKQLKIWSAGCSIGCEPYSLAMILSELDPRGAHNIIATDVDLPILNRAREGTGYLPAEVRAVPPAIARKYFVQEAGGTFKVSEEIKRKVTFRRHDLLSYAYPRDLDMILCRNVVIYFTDAAKAHIYRGFAGALRADGLLFIGGSEMIMRSGEIGFRTAGTNLYQRAA
ncbi:MAG TPA: protein-glutamate O-methyltransferase CheR [Usitatibacter sp.]|nr:protein-glutamate O-methyltransferase CheR [Usitatibacter sp.]